MMKPLGQVVVVLLLQITIHRTASKEYCHNEEFIADCYNYPYNGNGHQSVHQSDRVVLMTSALYGRMASGSCVKTDFGFVGCYENVINHAHARCSGQRFCAIRVPDAVLDKTRPCNEDLKNYLDASYVCLDVATPRAEGQTCDLASEGVKFEGYISNQVEELLRPAESKTRGHHHQRPPVLLRASPLNYDSPSCGDPRRPWIVKVMGGQRINVTLLDFYLEPGLDDEEPAIDSIPTDHLSPHLSPHPPTSPTSTSTSTTTSTTLYPLSHCDKYATFEDKAVFAAVESPNGNISSGGRNDTYAADEEYQFSPGLEMDPPLGEGPPRAARDVPVREGVGGGRVLCGRRGVKTSHAFLSRSNEVAVSIYRWNTDPGYKFLLRYEAIGCPDQLIHAPSNVWTRRESRSGMVVGCRGTPSLSWRLVCQGNVWVGSEANCSSAGAKDARREDGLPSLSIGASILIILGVSLAIGLTVLLFGLYYMKRRREMEMSRLPESTLLRSVKHPPSEGARESSCCAGFEARDSTLLAPVLTTRTSSYETSKSTSMTSSLGRPMARRATAYEYVWELQPDRGGRFSSPQLGEHQPMEHQARPDLVRLHDQRRSDPPTPLNCLILDEDVDSAKPGKQQRIHKNKMAEDRDAKDLKRRGDCIEIPRCTCFMQQQQQQQQQQLQQINQSYGRVVPRPPNTSGGQTTPGIDSLYSQVGDRKRTPPGSVGTPCSYGHPSLHHFNKPPSDGSSTDGRQSSKMASGSGGTSRGGSSSCLAHAHCRQTPLLPPPPPGADAIAPERMCRSCGHAIDRKSEPLESMAAAGGGIRAEKSTPFCCVTPSTSSSAKSNTAPNSAGTGQTNSTTPSLNSPNSL